MDNKQKDDQNTDRNAEKTAEKTPPAKTSGNGIGSRIAALRQNKKMTQEEFALRLGVTPQAVSKWERGEASPDTDNLIELAKIYEISLDELVGLEKKENKVMNKSSLFSKLGVIILSSITALTVIAYILLGSIFNIWNKAWVLFFLILIIPSLYETIKEKNMSKFSYTFFICFIYFTITVWILDFHLFHPLWVMFITIPVYYGVVKGIQKNK